MNIIEMKVTLEHVEPAVARILQVPSTIRLDRLHLTLQAEALQKAGEVWIGEDNLLTRA